MIKWNCNFNIPNSTIQTSLAVVVIDSFENRITNCKVFVKIFDENKEIVIKEYEKIIDGIYNDADEIYSVLINDFDNAEIV